MQGISADLTDKLFKYGMWWRMFYGSLKFILGIALTKTVGSPLLEIITRIMSHELAEDPGDLLYLILNNLLSSHELRITYFLALYFIFWGIIDVALSYNLLKEKLWAFPTSLVLISIFVIYEIIRFIQTRSLVLLGIILIDSAILWLVLKEYKKLKADKLTSQKPAF